MILLAAIAGAVWMARPVHAALMLALTLALVGVLYLVLGADFIGLGAVRRLCRGGGGVDRVFVAHHASRR
jgi:hypothetical protein